MSSSNSGGGGKLSGHGSGGGGSGHGMPNMTPMGMMAAAPMPQPQQQYQQQHYQQQQQQQSSGLASYSQSGPQFQTHVQASPQQNFAPLGQPNYYQPYQVQPQQFQQYHGGQQQFAQPTQDHAEQYVAQQQQIQAQYAQQQLQQPFQYAPQQQSMPQAYMQQQPIQSHFAPPPAQGLAQAQYGQQQQQQRWKGKQKQVDHNAPRHAPMDHGGNGFDQAAAATLLNITDFVENDSPGQSPHTGYGGFRSDESSFTSGRSSGPASISSFAPSFATSLATSLATSDESQTACMLPNDAYRRARGIDPNSNLAYRRPAEVEALVNSGNKAFAGGSVRPSGPVGFPSMAGGFFKGIQVITAVSTSSHDRHQTLSGNAPAPVSSQGDASERITARPPHGSSFPSVLGAPTQLQQYGPLPVQSSHAQTPQQDQGGHLFERPITNLHASSSASSLSSSARGLGIAVDAVNTAGAGSVHVQPLQQPHDATSGVFSDWAGLAGAKVELDDGDAYEYEWDSYSSSGMSGEESDTSTASIRTDDSSHFSRERPAMTVSAEARRIVKRRRRTQMLLEQQQRYHQLQQQRGHGLSAVTGAAASGGEPSSLPHGLQSSFSGDGVDPRDVPGFHMASSGSETKNYAEVALQLQRMLRPNLKASGPGQRPCDRCRRLKVKCDRQVPCSRCKHGNDECTHKIPIMRAGRVTGAEMEAFASMGIPYVTFRARLKTSSAESKRKKPITAVARSISDDGSPDVPSNEIGSFAGSHLAVAHAGGIHDPLNGEPGQRHARPSEVFADADNDFGPDSTAAAWQRHRGLSQSSAGSYNSGSIHSGSYQGDSAPIFDAHSAASWTNVDGLSETPAAGSCTLRDALSQPHAPHHRNLVPIAYNESVPSDDRSEQTNSLHLASLPPLVEELSMNSSKTAQDDRDLEGPAQDCSPEASVICPARYTDGSQIASSDLAHAMPERQITPCTVHPFDHKPSTSTLDNALGNMASSRRNSVTPPATPAMGAKSAPFGSPSMTEADLYSPNPGRTSRADSVASSIASSASAMAAASGVPGGGLSNERDAWTDYEEQWVKMESELAEETQDTHCAQALRIPAVYRRWPNKSGGMFELQQRRPALVHDPMPFSNNFHTPNEIKFAAFPIGESVDKWQPDVPHVVFVDANG